MIRTTLALLKASTAMQNRVDTLARNLGGVQKYGVNTPITLDQVRASNGDDDAYWVECNTNVHLADGQRTTENVAETPKENMGKKEVKITKKLEEAFVEVTKLEGTTVSSTVNQAERVRTTTIKIKSPIGSDLEKALIDLEEARK